jgi:hypothetical protein
MQMMQPAEQKVLRVALSTKPILLVLSYHFAEYFCYKGLGAYHLRGDNLKNSGCQKAFWNAAC